MLSYFKQSWQVVKSAASEWSDDQASMQAAALAYYMVFSIAPLLMISIGVAALVFGEQATQGHVFRALQGALGAEGARGVESLVKSAASQQRSGVIATVVGVVTLFLGASGVFQQLQQSLDLIWKVQPKRGLGIRAFLRQRLLSFSMILVISLLLLVSLLMSAALTAVGKFASGRLPGGAGVWQVINFGVSFAVISVLFAAIYKVLPDVQLRWRDTWIGGVTSALLFDIGKLCIATYLGRSSIASTYGAAASLVILLVWVYYSACILYFGAELIREIVTRGGRSILPKDIAEPIELQGVRPQTPAQPPTSAQGRDVA